MAFLNYTPANLMRRTHHLHRSKQPRRAPPSAVTASGTTTQVSTPTPLADRLLVRVDDKEDRTSGGIFLTDSGTEQCMTGTVVAVGPGRFSPEGVREELDFFKAGDKILWKDDFGAETITTESGESFLALRAFSVAAKF